MENTFDVLVVGQGLAGSVAALQASRLGARVAILHTHTAASRWAQGGIVYKGSGDPAQLKEDILRAGSFINNTDSVDILVKEGPDAIDSWFNELLNVDFDKMQEGSFDLALEAAHSEKRILHVKDHTGRAILDPLEELLRLNENISFIEGNVIDLILSDRHGSSKDCEYLGRKVLGAYYLSKSSKVSKILARSTILASGGYSGIFEHSSGPDENIGAGISIAHRAGAKTLHLEFIQFHPTTFFRNAEPRTLLTEALRGSGARLLDEGGNSFVDELAPRDQVARAIHQKIASSKASCVYLDLKPIEGLKDKFPGVARLLSKHKIDYLEEGVPVVPSAHYTIGGVWTDTQGKSSLEGLWACGEVACTGVHGANRLASTSLLEALVFGIRAGSDAFQSSKIDCIDLRVKDWEPGEESVDPILLQQDWNLLRQTMWNYVGLLRSEKRLKRAASLINELRTEVESFYKNGVLSSSLVNLRHAVIVASLTLYSALRRKKSLGSHYIEDSN